MAPSLKNTTTLIGSWISNINIIINRRKDENQEGKLQGFRPCLPAGRLQVLVCSLVFFLFTYPFSLSPIFAADPLAVPNNKVGIHIISATPKETSEAAAMVNAGGDWGYVTFLIRSDDRSHAKWQEFFRELRRRHLIPIVRLATKPVGPPAGGWEKPYEKEEIAWADFLDKLTWPTKNRYVIIYNEPNHGSEWGNQVDPKMYAETLDKFITALKDKNRDFFVLNSGLDSIAPQKPPNYFDEEQFLTEMEESVPGIFNKLDGWVCHCYPNPGFVGSPESTGRATVKGYQWELSVLRNLSLTKDLPIFITETGWKHSEGIIEDPKLPSAEMVAKYYDQVFKGVWSDPQIVAVTPFLLEYSQLPFDHFSFKKSSTEYYPQFQAIKELPKVIGQPELNIIDASSALSLDSGDQNLIRVLTQIVL